MILINMDMPETCIWCPMFNGEWGICQATQKVAKRKDCPLVPVPEHGRLIDADEFTALMFADPYQDFVHIIEQMPTIIPAEEGE